jgi:hypothetical protein
MTDKTNQSDLKPCRGCGVAPEQAHEEGCDWAKCPECGEQRDWGCDHDSDQPSIWHGIDPRAEVAQAREWWTTATGIDHLVEDYTRVLVAIGRGDIDWDPQTQRYVDVV